jgi:PIN domain nuclease of toxin-antitoxin system
VSSKQIVDAHALIWYLEGNPKLGGAAKAVLDDPISELVLPIIALAEAVYAVTEGKTFIPDAATLLDRVDRDPRIEVYPLTYEVLKISLGATSVPEMHDRLIVASGLHLQTLGHQLSILTKDMRLQHQPCCP